MEHPKLSWRERPFTWSLLALSVALIIAPSIGHIDPGGMVYYLALLLAIFGATQKRWIRRGSVLFVVLASATHVGSAAAGGVVAAPVLFAVDLTLAGFTPVLVIRHVLSQTHVDSEEMAGALVSYALIGVLFALLHGLIGSLLPGSYSGKAHGGEVVDFVYFSFVTLTTLGYGDIVPTHSLARGVAIFEAFFGQGYFAILVARLVGLRVAMQIQSGG